MTVNTINPFGVETKGLRFSGFSLSNLPVEGVRYSGDSLLIDRRFLTRYADEFLTDTFNIEFIARACSDRNTRLAVMEALENDTMAAVFKEIYKTPFVDVDVPLFTKGHVLSSVRAIMSASGDERAAAVIAEIMLTVLKPLGVIDPTDKGYVTLHEHGSFFPNYNDFLVDIWAREIEKVLQESRRIDVGSGKRKIGTSVIAARLASIASDLALCFQNVGDYAVYAQDTLTLVRANLLPREARRGTTPFYPMELVSHPVIKALAANYTIARMALQNSKAGGELRTGIFLRDRLPQVSAFFFESKRYVKVSFSDFIQHFRKSTYRTMIDQRFIGALISYNMEGAPAAQAVTSTRSLLIEGVRIVREREAVTKALQAHYGSLMKSISTDRTHATTDSVLSSIYTGQHIQRHEPFLGSILPESLRAYEDELIQTLAVALTSVGEAGAQVFICESGGADDHLLPPMDDGSTFSLGFQVPMNGYHLPVSGVQSHELWALHDPREVVALAKDWEGSFYLADKIQVIPQQALRKYLVGSAELGLNAVRGYSEMLLDVNGVTLRGGFQFLGTAISSLERDAMVVRPILNAQVTRVAMAVMDDLLSILDENVREVPHRVQYKRNVYAYWHAAATKGIGSSVDIYREAIKQACASNAKISFAAEGPVNDEALLTQLRRVQAALDEDAVERCIGIFVLDQVLQLLSLVKSDASQSGRTSVLFDRLKKDADFNIIMTGL